VAVTKRFLPAVLGVALAVVLFIPASTVGQGPIEDSATGSGANLQFTDIQLDVHSDPGGANPSGRVSISTVSTFEGPVVCLAVTGNRALIGFTDPFVGFILALAIDNRPPGTTGLPPDEFYAAPSNPADGCAPLISGTGGQLLRGDIVVRDAPAVPISKAQCESGGWRSYPDFKNQGDCVSFVVTRGRNQPASPPA
jgi:hypothetical protein